MICYLDRTFCVSPNCENKCGRKLTDEIRQAARVWWGSDNAPIAMGWFCGEVNVPPNKEATTND
jgi:hypothetical protein